MSRGLIRMKHRNPLWILGEEHEELSQYASKFNLQIAYHTHVGRRIATMDEIDKLFQFTKSTKLCLDTANVVAAGIDPIHMLNKYKEKIIYVQLKDWKKDKGKEFWDQCVELGEGDLKDVFPKFLSRLDEINYQKWIYSRTGSFNASLLKVQK